MSNISIQYPQFGDQQPLRWKIEQGVLKCESNEFEILPAQNGVQNTEEVSQLWKKIEYEYISNPSSFNHLLDQNVTKATVAGVTIQRKIGSCAVAIIAPIKDNQAPMLEFAHKCFEEGLIPEKLLAEIKDKKDINAGDANKRTLLHHLCLNKDIDKHYVSLALEMGAEPTLADAGFYTPLMHAMSTGRSDLFKMLKTRGGHDYQAFSLTSENFVSIAVIGGNIEILRDVLTKVHDPLSTNRFGRTPLHLAARLGRDLIPVLIEDERFQDSKSQRDIFGDTPQDLAARYQHRNAFIALADNTQEIQSHPKYNKPFMDTGQTTIENKLRRYLENQGRDTNILDEKGMCNGWAFLYQTFLPDREDEYWDIVNFICGWDGNIESFDTLTLPQSLQQKYGKKEGTASGAENIFEQLINDVTVFFDATPELTALRIGTDQIPRVQQFQLVGSMDRSIRPEFSLGHLTLSRDQLIEQLEYMRTFPEMTVDIGGQQHQISLYITKDGNFKLFDSAIPGRICEMTNAEEVADTIIKNKYMVQKMTNQYWVELSTYKITKGNEPSAIQRTPSVSAYDFSHSPNGYNALHYAILDNDIEKVKLLIVAQPELMFKVNAHDQTPMDLAMLTQRLDCFDILINSRRLEDEELNIVANKSADASNPGFMGSFIKAQPHFNPNMLWRNIMSDGNPLLTMEGKYKKAMLLLPLMKGKVDIDVVEDNINPPLMDSIKENHMQFFDYLLENNASYLNCDAFNEKSVYTLCLAQENPYYLHKILEKVGDHINELDKLGNNVLHWAVLKGRPDVVKACLEKGARADVKNREGKSVFELMEATPNSEIEDLLRSA